MIKKLFLLTIIFFGIFQIWNVFATKEPDFNVEVNIPEPTVPEIDFWDTDIIVPEVSTDNSNRYNPWDKYDGVTESGRPDKNIDTTKKVIWEINKDISEIKKEMDWLDKNSEEYKKLSNELEDKNKERKEELKLHNEQRAEECKASWDCIDKDTFMFNPSEMIWIGPNLWGKSTWEWVNNVFGTVIQKLMVALWVLSVLIMTIGGWYIILYHGQDELLSKGKSIFMSGVIALIVALSSYLIVGLLRFILYNT